MSMSVMGPDRRYFVGGGGAGRGWRCYLCQKPIGRDQGRRNIIVANISYLAHINCAASAAPVGGVGRRVPKRNGADGFDSGA